LQEPEAGEDSGLNDEDLDGSGLHCRHFSPWTKHQGPRTKDQS
jgi:hypothetical protein